MTSETPLLPDSDSEVGRRFRDRLDTDLVAWLSVVSGSGTPQPAPVWFLWVPQKQHVVIYSQTSARRLDWIDRNDRAALHFNDDGRGHDYLVLTGTLHRLDSAHHPGPANDPAFLAKYRALMDEVFGAPEAYAEMFSVPLTFMPRRTRAH